MIEVKLTHKRDNFGFIDPESGLFLTLLHNKGVVTETTPLIENGVASGVLEIAEIVEETIPVETVEKEEPKVDVEEIEEPKAKTRKKKSE